MSFLKLRSFVMVALMECVNIVGDMIYMILIMVGDMPMNA